MHDTWTNADLVALLGVPAVTRRQILVTSLAAGFALAVQPVSAETITTDTEGLTAGEVRVPVADGEIPAYRAMPATGGKFPIVLVVQEIFGVHEHITRRVPAFRQGRLSRRGARVVRAPGRRVEDERLEADLRRGRRESARRAGHVRPRCDRGVGRQVKQGRRGAPRRDRFLLGRPRRVALRGTQREAEGGRRLVWSPHRGQDRVAAEIPARHRRPISRRRCWGCTAARTRASRRTRSTR